MLRRMYRRMVTALGKRGTEGPGAETMPRTVGQASDNELWTALYPIMDECKVSQVGCRCVDQVTGLQMLAEFVPTGRIGSIAATLGAAVGIRPATFEPRAGDELWSTLAPFVAALGIEESDGRSLRDFTGRALLRNLFGREGAAQKALRAIVMKVRNKLEADPELRRELGGTHLTTPPDWLAHGLRFHGLA